MLFNEPKLLKSNLRDIIIQSNASFSALQRAEIAEMPSEVQAALAVIFVSVLFNEPKLLKSTQFDPVLRRRARFSALQRAEIAEMAA